MHDHSDFSDFVAGGYFIVRPRPAGPAPGGREQTALVSVSPHLCDVGPDANWATSEAALRIRDEPLGIPESEIEAAAAWVVETATVRPDSWPDVLASPDTGRNFARRFALSADDLLLIGIGLHASLVDGFLGDDDDLGGAFGTAASGEPLTPGGHDLGFELLQVGYGGERHSWACYDLPAKASEDLGVSAGPSGLIASMAVAQRVATWADDEDTCEPGVPFDPWLLVRYDWD